ncbi:MAG: HAMP domain-containing protein, partial [Chloroflexi bacterium]
FPWVIGLLCLISAGLIIGGRPSAGGRVFLVSFSLGLILLTMNLSGIGFVSAALAFVVIGFMADLILPNQISGWSPVFSLVVVVAILLLDAFVPWQRDWMSENDLPVAIAITAALLMVYFFVVARQFRMLPLHTKLMYSFLIAVILPVAVVGGLSSLLTRQALTENADQTLLSSAAQVAARLDNFVLNNLSEIRTQAQAGDLADFLEIPPAERESSEAGQHIQSLLNVYKKRDPVFINSYGILDRKGISVADTNPDDVGIDKSDRSYYNEEMSTGLNYASTLVQSEDTGEPVIYFSAPIRSQSGELLGVLRVRYNAVILQQLLTYKESFGAEQALSILVDDHNIMLANSEMPDLMFKSIQPLEDDQIAELQSRRLLSGLPADQLFVDLVVLAKGVQNSVTQPVFSGDIHTTNPDYSPDSPFHREEAAVAHMSAMPWNVVVAAPQDVLFAPVKQQARSILLIGIGVSMLVVLLAVLLSQYISKPVLSLTETANKLASGDLTARAAVRSRDEIGMLAATFNTMAADLHNLFGSMEQRVADRTRALSTSAEVSRRISSILDTNQLISEVVEQLKSAFSFYHVHIYLFDDARQYLVMAGGSGEAGKTMLARGHKIVRGRGLVGRAAETVAPVLAKDVSQAPGWLPNSLLPDTRSEVAVPIATGGNVLGVLDVQQDRVNGLAEEDADLLQSIANQVAVALQNTRMYAQAQHRARREALISAIGQRIQHTTSTEEALKIAVREVGRALNTENVHVRVGFPEDERE